MYYMKILLLGFGNASGRYQPPSTHCENYITRYMGEHEIITFGYNEGVDIIIEPDDDFEKVVAALPEGWVPDICLLWLLEWNLLPRGIELAPFRTCACMFDWDYDTPNSRACMESVDLLIVTGDYDKETVELIGANNAEAFYFAGAMREYVNPHPKRISDRKYDILYTTWIDDSLQPGRSDWISKLSLLSEKYRVHIDSHLPYPEYLALLNDSKLVMSYNRHGSMAVRVTDAGSQGTVVLDSGEGTKKHFIPDEEYIQMSHDNFAAQIDTYLGDEEALQNMSDRFHEKVENTFEARTRFLELLELAQSKLKGKTGERKFNSLREEEKYIRRGEMYYYSHFAGAPGVFFLSAGSKLLESSIECFSKAIEINPSPRALVNHAVATAAYHFAFRKDNVMEDRGRKLISLIEDIITEHPTYAMAYFNLGILHFRTGNLSEAVHVFKKADEIFERADSVIDVWCLQNRDFDIYNELLRSRVNGNIILAARGDEMNARDNMRNMCRAVMTYLIALIQEESGNVCESLDTLMNARCLYPESGVIARRTARITAYLGLKEESLNLYKQAICLCPVDSSLRIEYIQLLYLYKNDKALMNEIKDALKIMRSVTTAKEYSIKLKERLAAFTRFNPDLTYAFDSFNESLLNSWIEILFDHLRKNPENLNCLLRIIQIWDELGRTDKILEITEDYVSHFSDDINADENSRKCFQDILSYLKEINQTDNSLLEDKYEEVASMMTGVRQAMHSNYSMR